MDDLQHTSHTLLGRALNLNDQAAWQELYVSYNKFIYYFLHRMEVNPADLDDLNQQVMVQLTKDLKSYDREKGPFRPWLRTVVRNTTLMHFRKRNTRQKYHDKLQQETTLAPQPDRSDFDHFFDKEWEDYIISQALELIKPDFSENAIRIVELERAGQTVQEMATLLEISTDSVYKLSLIHI